MAQQQQLQMMLLQHQLDADTKMKTAAVHGAAQGPPQGGGGGKGGARNAPGGRPAKHQFEGKTPGAGLTTLIRELGGNIGASGLGLEGMGETPERG
jgi:hypothetical protein